MPVLGDLYNRYPADMAQVVVLRVFGIRATGPALTWKARRCVPFLLAVSVPFAAAASHQLFFPTSTPHGRTYYLWMLYYTAVDLYVVLCQWLGCRTFHAMTDSMDRTLTDRGRIAVHAWIDRGTSQKRQWRYMALGSAAGAVVMFTLTRAQGVTQRMYVDLASYLVVSVTGAAAANSAYWILRAVKLAKIITNLRNVTLLWFAPARTVGVERVARWYRFVALLSAVGFSIAFVPVIYVSGLAPGNSLLTATKWALAGTSMVAIAVFGLYSQWRLSALVEQSRAYAVERIARALPRRPPASSAQISDADARINDLLSYVIASPTTVVNGQTLASTLLAVVTGALPFIVTVLAR